MEIKKGIGVSGGIAVREAFVLESEDVRIPERSIASEGRAVEKRRFREALEVASGEVRRLKEEMDDRFGNVASIFEAHLQILADPVITDEVEGRIDDDLYTAEYALSTVLRKYVKMLRGMSDEYFAGRHADIQDIERRLLRVLIGERRERLSDLTREVVIVAHDLTPSQTVMLPRNKVIGFATEAGGPTSHTAIVANTLGIPAVVGLGEITSDVSGGDLVIIDGYTGKVILRPDEPTLARYLQKEAAHLAREKELARFRKLLAETLDGHECALLANIELPAEIPTALKMGAEGIGLFRTEFLYIDRAPSEEEHLEAYQSSLSMLGERPLVIRTFDFGADKVMGEEGAPDKNPFLGCRSIRLCLQRLDLFKTQLRAILRAATRGNVRILFPMISSLEEVRRVKVVLAEVSRELRGEGVPMREDIEIGIMIEIPSAAIAADTLAPEIDFFSIGTNDLIQYALAVDRGNERVAGLYQPAHPAILRLIKNVLDVGARRGVKVCMCGEMAGDPVFTLPLLGMGLREFSVSPHALPRIKKIIRSTVSSSARQITNRLLAYADAGEATRYLTMETRKLAPELF